MAERKLTTDRYRFGVGYRCDRILFRENDPERFWTYFTRYDSVDSCRTYAGQNNARSALSVNLQSIICCLPVTGFPAMGQHRRSRAGADENIRSDGTC